MFQFCKQINKQPVNGVSNLRYICIILLIIFLTLWCIAIVDFLIIRNISNIVNGTFNFFVSDTVQKIFYCTLKQVVTGYLKLVIRDMEVFILLCKLFT